MTILEAGRVGARELGAYYTPESAARLMAEWTLARDGVRLLEPSMGDGAFLGAVANVVAENRLDDVETWGVEYAAEAFQAAVIQGLVPRERAIHSDFLAVDPFPVDGVIGNPPYVRLRHLPEDEAQLAREVADSALGFPMDPSGSVWMPFVLHSLSFLREGGRLALVLPYDFTYVRYARPLWQHLADRFGSLRLIRVKERIFPDLLQEVVVLLAADFGDSTPAVELDAYETHAHFLAGRPLRATEIPIREVVEGERPFVEALLPSNLRHLLHKKLFNATVDLGSVARFNIGYVSGDKSFFHPSEEEIERYEIEPRSLLPAVTSARQVRGAGIYTAGLRENLRSTLFAPGPLLTPGEADYVAEGERLEVDQRYKCQVRKPWWVVPGITRPDLIVSVFGEEPCMLINDADLVASNSMLCGSVHPDANPKHLVAGWYTPLAALYRELQIHSLGGGTFVLVPGEISRVRIPDLSGSRSRLSLRKLDRAVQQADFPTAYEWGRSTVLEGVLGLTRKEIDLIDEGRDVLADWRRSAGRGPVPA